MSMTYASTQLAQAYIAELIGPMNRVGEITRHAPGVVEYEVDCLLKLPLKDASQRLIDRISSVLEQPYQHQVSTLSSASETFWHVSGDLNRIVRLNFYPTQGLSIRLMDFTDTQDDEE